MIDKEAAVLYEVVRQCALHGVSGVVTNANLDVAWQIEADTKVDNDDLCFPVIVHLRGGTIDTDGLAIGMFGEEVAL